VSVSAKDKATGKEQQIKIQASGGLSDVDIEKMVKDAESNAAEDKKKKELVEARNHADSLVYSTEKSLTEFGDKVSAEDKKKIEDDIAAVKAALEKGDAEEVKKLTQELVQSSMKLGEAVYKAQQAAGGDAAAAGDAPKEGVVDADFEEVKDSDKKAGNA
jgi:molecular chaperone DnaK